MAKNELIELKQLVSELQDLLKQQAKAWGDIATAVQKVNASKPSNYINANKEVAKDVQKVNELEEKQIKIIERKATAQQRLNTGSGLGRQKEKELQLTAKQVAQEEKLNNVYNKVQAKVNQMTAVYNNLATKKELGLKLNDRELAQLNSLEGRLNNYQNVLRKVDAQIGNNRRNVGNYASGWDGLGNSINQITREMPAFAVSASTGFLALSNNIPILADEIKRVSDNVAEMRAKGQEVPSVLSQIMKSMLSWQTLLSVGVTLLTIYGGEIVKWVAGFFEAEKVIDRVAESKKALNEVNLQGSKDAQKEIIELNKYVAIVKDVSASTESRVKSAKKLQELYPQYFKDMTTDQIMTSNLTAIQKELTNALLARAVAVASINKMTENATKILDAKEEIRLNNERIETVRKQADAEFKLLEQQTRSAKEGVFGTNANRKYKEWNAIAEENRKKMQEITALELQNIRLSKVAQDNTTASVKLDNQYANASQSNSEKAVDYTKDRIKSEYELARAILNRQLIESKDEYEKNAIRMLLANSEYEEKKKLTELEIQDEITRNNTLEALREDYYTKISNILQSEADAEKKVQEELSKATTKGLQDRWKETKDFKEKQEKLAQELKDKLKDTFTQGAFGTLDSLGGGGLANFFNGEFETMWKSAETFEEKFALVMQSIGAISQQVFSQISERQNANFEAQLSRLEREKEANLTFAGDSASAREAIERQYDEKRRQIQKRQAEAQKKMAILQILTNTAVGVTSALAMLPPNIPLSIAIGVMGAVQAGIVASTPIPEFWTGTDNAPEGWALTQERGAETILDKNGNVKTLGNNKGAQMTYLSKGDQVLNAQDTIAFHRDLNNMLVGNGISPIVSVNNGITKEDLKDVMLQTLGSQAKNHINIDSSGFNMYQEKQNSRKTLKNKNARF